MYSLLVISDQVQQKWVLPVMKARLGKDDTRESALQDKKETCKAKLSSYKRVPQGTMQKALEAFRSEHQLGHDYSMTMFRRDLAYKEFDNEWRTVLRKEFDAIWARECKKAIESQSAAEKSTGVGAAGTLGNGASLHGQAQAPVIEDAVPESSEGAQVQALANLDENLVSENGGSSSQVQASEPITILDEESDVSKEQLRTCRTSLKHVLRKELIPESDLIIARLDACQQSMNEITVEMSVVAQKVALLVSVDVLKMSRRIQDDL